MRWVAAVLVVAAVTSARADGGPPMTLQIELAANDPHSLYVMSNYGLLISHDDGCTFEWVCEPNVGYGGAYIPKFRVAADGAIFATTHQGLRVSRNGGCSFTTTTAEISIHGLDVADTGEVWITTAGNNTTNDVLVSHDNGETFEPSGLASSTVYWHSVRAAPGDPTRVYASGFELGGVQLRRRDGDSWIELPVGDLALGSPGRLVIAAIAPTDPDVVFVVSEGALPAGGDRLYRSEDGGMTFAEVYSIDGLIRDVVVRDASNVIVTVMVREGLLSVAGPASISSDGGKSFALLANAPTLACLTVAPDGSLVGCSANWEPAFQAVTRFDGSAWTKVWRFVELSAPLACAPGTGGHDTCDAMWPALDRLLITSGPTCGPHVRDPGIPEMPSEPPPPPIETCCGTSNGPSSWLWTLVVVWWLGRSRRRQEIVERRRG